MLDTIAAVEDPTRTAVIAPVFDAVSNLSSEIVAEPFEATML